LPVALVALLFSLSSRFIVSIPLRADFLLHRTINSTHDNPVAK
jgi:hypothetical protein